MKQKKNWLALVGAVALLVAVGIVCFFLGENAAMQRSRKEKEFNIRLNRSELEYLDEIEGPIYVTGHKSPDSDTVGSSIAYAALLQSLGYDAHPVVLGSINSETKYILEAAGLETPEQMEDASGCNMILVDHSELTHSAEGMRDAQIVGVIDHHGIGSVTAPKPLLYDAKPLGATATVVWIRYCNYGLVPDRQTALVMLGALLSDTNNLKTGTTAADREALKALSSLAGIQDTDAFYQGMFKASIAYEDMSDEEIFFSDYKEYTTASGTTYGIACVSAYDEEAAADLLARMQAEFPSAAAGTGMDLLFAQISIFHDDISITYLVPSNEAAFEVLETAFRDRATFDGMICRLEPGISRKSVLVPAIVAVLEAHPGE